MDFSNSVSRDAMKPSPPQVRVRSDRGTLEQRNALKHTTHKKKRDGEPTEAHLTPLGAPGKYLTPEQKKAWAEILRLSPKRVLTESDRVIVEVLACLMVEGRKKGWHNLTGAQLTRTERCLALMGMTPAHRSHVRPLPEDKPASAYDD